jgi:hypothetical protein
VHETVVANIFEVQNTRNPVSHHFLTAEFFVNCLFSPRLQPR